MFTAEFLINVDFLKKERNYFFFQIEKKVAQIIDSFL